MARKTNTFSAALLSIVLCLSSCDTPAPPELPHEDALYIWQRVWNDDTRASVAKASDVAGHLMVLALEAETAPIRVDWAALAATGRPVTAVFRYPRLSADETHVARVRSDIESIVAEASDAGLRLAGLQLDFDSPTSKLADYRKLIVALKPALPPGKPLSITALPTWLDSPDFTKLVGELDYYVLQVHSFEPPESIETPLVLCDTEKIDGYAAKASAVGVPYHIAFPTHGYEVAYNQDGQFAGLTAEGAPNATWPPGYQTRDVRADPDSIAAAVARLTAQRPDWCRGHLWFRMPVATDTRNWSWPTLAAVMKGRAPTREYHAEIRYPDPGLAEVWLANTGEDRVDALVQVAVKTPAGSVLAYDGINRFRVRPGDREVQLVLDGLAPTGSEAVLIGWFRMKDSDAASSVEVAIVGEVQ